MKRTQARAALLLSFFIIGCGAPAPAPEDVELTIVQTARREVQDARKHVAALERQSADAAELGAARAAFVASYDRYQALLASYLTTALNAEPHPAGLDQALAMYADAALEQATELRRRGRTADAAGALRRAADYHRAAGLDPPARLSAALAAAP